MCSDYKDILKLLINFVQTYFFLSTPISQQHMWHMSLAVKKLVQGQILTFESGFRYDNLNDFRI